jgi:hypothetical protein
MSPQYIIIVPVDLEQPFELVYVASGWKNAFKVTHAGQLLLRFEEDQPVLRTEDLETGVVVELLEVVDVLGVVAFVLVAVAEQSLLLLLLYLLQILAGVVLDPDQVQYISEQGMLDLPVHGRRGAETGTNVDLHQPRFQLIVDQNVEPVELEPTGALVLRFGVDVQHHWLCTYAGFDDHFLYLVEQLR